MAVTNSNVRTPDDSAEIGKRVRTRQRTVDAVPVHEHVVQVVYPEDVLGVYDVASGLTVVETAHAADAGYCLLLNPPGSAVTMAVRRMRFMAFATSTTTHPSAPIVTGERVSLTGTPSGATETAAKRRSAAAAPVGSLRLATTGLTVNPVAVMRRYHVPLVPAGGGNPASPVEAVWEPLGEEGEVVLAAGEGILIRQHTNGESGDARRINIGFSWLEY